MDYFVVGLGNPGLQYVKTRHNAGRIILTRLFPDGWDYDKYLNAVVMTRKEENQHVHYFLPETFMNESGKTISGILKSYSTFSSPQLVVIYDDLDLPFGTIRVSYDRGSGGHNGVASIIQHLDSKAFMRIRIGIAKTLEDGRVIKPAVLGNFEPDEYQLVEGTLSKKVADILTLLFKKGIESTMNTYNQGNPPS